MNYRYRWCISKQIRNDLGDQRGYQKGKLLGVAYVSVDSKARK